MKNHNQLPRFDHSLLPAGVREAVYDVNIFDYKEREIFLTEATLPTIQSAISDSFHVAYVAFLEEVFGSNDEAFAINAKNHMNRMGYILFDFIVPVILQARKKPAVALNLLDAYYKACWFYDEAPRLRAAFEEAQAKCYFELEEKMIADLKRPHKGVEREEKFARLFKIIQQDMEKHSFMRFLKEFTNRVERKPEDVNLLLSDTDYHCSAAILNKVFKVLEARKKFDVVTKIKETSECDTVLRMAA